MQTTLKYPPRVIRLKDAPQYLGTNINFFNKHIRPNLKTVPIGESQAVGFDRLDLDAWVDKNKGRGKRRPMIRGDSLWDENARQVSTNVKAFGTLTNISQEDAFVKALAQINLRKQKNI